MLESSIPAYTGNLFYYDARERGLFSERASSFRLENVKHTVRAGAFIRSNFRRA